VNYYCNWRKRKCKESPRRILIQDIWNRAFSSLTLSVYVQRLFYRIEYRAAFIFSRSIIIRLLRSLVYSNGFEMFIASVRATPAGDKRNITFVAIEGMWPTVQGHVQVCSQDEKGQDMTKSHVFFLVPPQSRLAYSQGQGLLIVH